MKTIPSDPIVDEVRKARQEHAAKFDHDINAIFRSLRARQQASSRKYVRYPARQTAAEGCCGMIGQDR